MSGAQFKALRQRLGYTASEVAAHFAAFGAPMTTERSVYRLEHRDVVPERYVTALRELVGEEAFIRATATTDGVGGTGIAPSAGGDRAGKRRRDRRSDPSGEPDAERFVQFLNALPTVPRMTEWINLFREALRELFGDVDRVTVNVNYMCNLHEANTDQPGIVMTEHVGPNCGRSIVRVQTGSTDQSPTDRLLEQFRSNGYDLEAFWPPISQDYHFGGAYLGTIFLWRRRMQPQVSKESEALFRALDRFIVFALTDVVARHHHVTPFERAFDDALANLRREAKLTERESRTLLLLLLGHSYKEIAANIPLSLDAVRKQISSIYRKTGTRSSAELFAKYFTHRRVL